MYRKTSNLVMSNNYHYKSIDEVYDVTTINPSRFFLSRAVKYIKIHQYFIHNLYLLSCYNKSLIFSIHSNQVLQIMLLTLCSTRFAVAVIELTFRIFNYTAYTSKKKRKISNIDQSRSKNS